MTMYDELEIILESYQSYTFDVANKLLNRFKDSHKTYGDLFEAIKKAERDITYTHSAQKHIIEDIFRELKNILEKEIGDLPIKKQL